MTVPSRIHALAELFESRNPAYGDAYKKFGAQAFALLGEQKLSTAEDYGRIGIVLECIAKLARYCNNFSRGGHPDSLDDNAVYSQMLQELDDEARKARQAKTTSDVMWKEEDDCAVRVGSVVVGQANTTPICVGSGVPVGTSIPFVDWNGILPEGKQYPTGVHGGDLVEVAFDVLSAVGSDKPNSEMAYVYKRDFARLFEWDKDIEIHKRRSAIPNKYRVLWFCNPSDEGVSKP